jgi:hypothetical protein
VSINQGYRINKSTAVLSQIKNKEFSRYQDRFDYTEDFDCIQNIKHVNLFYNLKMICDDGGAQTRSLNIVYNFIDTQMCYLLKERADDVYFINILDGDTSYKSMKYFHYLTSKEIYREILPFIFVGDMEQFSKWFRYSRIL